jgi:hypothetical protein
VLVVLPFVTKRARDGAEVGVGERTRPVGNVTSVAWVKHLLRDRQRGDDLRREPRGVGNDVPAKPDGARPNCRECNGERASVPPGEDRGTGREQPEVE